MIIYNNFKQNSHIEQNQWANEIIEEKGVNAKIIDINLSNQNSEHLEITLQLLNGNNVGKIVKDKVSHVPNNSLTWKYFSLLKALNFDISNMESYDNIDLDELVKNKTVKINLSVYAKEVNGEIKKYQKINYACDVYFSTNTSNMANNLNNDVF